MARKPTLATLKSKRLPVTPAGSRPYSQIEQAIGRDTLVMARFLPKIHGREAALKKQIAIIDAFFEEKKIAAEKRDQPYRGHVALYGIKADKIFYVAPGSSGGEIKTAIEFNPQHFARLGAEAWEILLSLVEFIAAKNSRAVVLDIPNEDRGPLYDPEDNSWHFTPVHQH
jgi:hypothetical protein